MTLKVKTFETWMASELDKKINKFIDNDKIEVLNIQLSAGLFSVYAQVQYKEK